MELLELFNIQGTLFLMILVGALVKKLGIVDEAGRRCLTDLCVNVIIPCNILKSCLIDLDSSVLRACEILVVVALAIQIISVILNKFLYKNYPEAQNKVLKYCTLVSNGGFLGNGVAEGVYGTLGLLYASMYLIPMRIVMWSAGTSYFVAGGTDKKKVVRNILTHPCLVAVYIGMAIMLLHIPLPTLLTSTITGIGNCNCNTAITMFIIGTILVDVPLLTIVNPTTLWISALRLVLLPAAAWGISLALGLEPVATGVAVIMTGMPAGSTAAIFAARYGSDAVFATKCVVLSTLLSMLTIPVWCYLIGA